MDDTDSTTQEASTVESTAATVESTASTEASTASGIQEQVEVHVELEIGPEQVKESVKEVSEHLKVARSDDAKDVVVDDNGEDDLDVDPAVLIVRANRKGSRDRYYKTLSHLHFYFHFKGREHDFVALENHVERRVIGKKTRYELHDGVFELPRPFSSSADPHQPRDRIRYKLADLYIVNPDTDMKLFVAIKPGNKIPLITDLIPHQEGLFDPRKAIFLPFSEERNVMMELPNSEGLFFTSQIVSGGEIFVAYDKALRKYWPMVVNQVYIPSKDVGLASDETSWRRAVENQSYVERILQLLAGLGTNLEVVIRISPATKFLGNGSQRIHPSQMRIDNYFRDEILNSKLNLRCYYYEEAVMLYGFSDNGDWKFGLKDRSSSNGLRICVKTPTSLYMFLEETNFPI